MLFSQYKIVTIDHCFYDNWWLLKEPFIFRCSTYCSKSKSKKSEIASSCSAICFRSFNSVECRICFSGTLAMKFWSTRTSIFFNLTSLLIFGNGVLSTKELLGRERSLSTSNSACEIKASRSLSYSIVNLDFHTWK